MRLTTQRREVQRQLPIAGGQHAPHRRAERAAAREFLVDPLDDRHGAETVVGLGIRPHDRPNQPPLLQLANAILEHQRVELTNLTEPVVEPLQRLVRTEATQPAEFVLAYDRDTTRCTGVDCLRLAKLVALFPAGIPDSGAGGGWLRDAEPLSANNQHRRSRRDLRRHDTAEALDQRAGFASAERIVCSYTQRGVWHIADLDTGPRTLRPVPTPFTEITRAGMVVSSKGVVFGAGSPTMAASVMYHDLASGRTQSLRSTSDAEVDDGYVSAPRTIEFPTERGLTAHAFFYPPKNRDYAAPEDKRPPLLVMSHGGPTGTTSSTLNLNVQYWTSRGIAVLDVNYGGSSGYGTEYRRRLNGQWGVVDIDDCVNGSTYLVERGEVDGERLAIKGGSAGGYTTLSALTFRDVFKAGASYFGISDLEAMTRDTHKFESRYLDSMIGPYPERRDLYVERSPIHHTEGLSCPIILFQGLEDKVVPPNQAEMMVDAMRKKGLPVAYVPFEGEQHGFRRAENIKRALEAELYFYSRVFGFDLADPVEPVDIENL